MFAREVQQLRDLGAKDIILDPGFGFGKNLIQNYQIYTAAGNRQALFTKKFIFFCSNYLSNHVELFFLQSSP